MHPNFYHWHAHAELKPDPTILEPRWNAAVKFAGEATGASICSLLHLVLFPGAEPEFAQRFSAALVKAEPTFPIVKNAELLRVMAAATISSLLEKPSFEADAIALGLRAASFPQGRVEPVCQEIIMRADKHLAEESERIRPEIDTGTWEKAEKQTQDDIEKLKQAVESNELQGIGKATEHLGVGLLKAVKESHKNLSEAINRLSEESQFLWWLIGHWSPILKKPREQMSIADYAFPAGAEAAERVKSLPPALSAEAFIREVLTQCRKGGTADRVLVDFVQAADADWLLSTPSKPLYPALTPLTALLAERKQCGQVGAADLKKLNISAKVKASPVEISQQYFRELMFLRAVEDVS